MDFTLSKLGEDLTALEGQYSKYGLQAPTVYKVRGRVHIDYSFLLPPDRGGFYEGWCSFEPGLTPVEIQEQFITRIDRQLKKYGWYESQ